MKKDKTNRHQTKRHILLNSNLVEDISITLDPSQKRHYIDVLRLDENSEVNLTDGKGALFEARLINIGNEPKFKIFKKINEKTPPKELQLVVGLTKPETMEWIVEKATECGVTSIQPVICSRSIIRADAKAEIKWLERWQKISDQAIEQSEKLFKVDVKPVVNWKKWKSSAENFEDSYVFVSESRGDKEFTKNAFLETVKKLQKSASKAIRVFVGPEGGFSSEEREELKSLKFCELTLGDSVFRSETATVVSLTLVQLSRQF